MTGFIRFVNQLSNLDTDATDELLKHLDTRNFTKGDFLLKRGEVCRNLYFIESGLAKTYFMKEGKDFIMRFFPEDSMFTVLDSFLAESPSTYEVKALEDTSVIYISKAKLDALCKKHHSMETFLRKLISIASIRMMNRISEMLEENGTARYTNFVRENNDILRRISLGDLASYLGISQVSLSRIRKKK